MRSRAGDIAGLCNCYQSPVGRIERQPGAVDAADAVGTPPVSCAVADCGESDADNRPVKRDGFRPCSPLAYLGKCRRSGILLRHVTLAPLGGIRCDLPIRIP